MKSLVIVGAGGLGRETAALVEDINAVSPQWELLGFVDDDPTLTHIALFDAPVLGSVDWLSEQQDLHYVIAIGSSQVRQRLGEHLQTASLRAATLIHPSVSLHASVNIKPGTLIFRGAVMMLSASIKRHVVIDVNSTIGHDSDLGAFTTVHPGVHLSGSVTVGAAVELGTGAVVLPGLEIGDQTTVGAGAVVEQSLPPRCTAVGVPARPLDR